MTKVYHTLHFGFFLIRFSINSISQVPPECDLKRDSDGIKVYTCKTENEKFRMLISEFELVNTSLQKLQTCLFDVKGYLNWQYNMIEAEKISDISADEMIYRTLVDAPWPVEDRELLLSFKVVKSHNMLQTFVHSIDYDKPAPPDVVRVPFFDATWKVLVQGKNLKITYRLRIDPGGSVPAFLANLAMAEGPYISFKKLKDQIEGK